MKSYLKIKAEDFNQTQNKITYGELILNLKNVVNEFDTLFIRVVNKMVNVIKIFEIFKTYTKGLALLNNKL